MKLFAILFFAMASLFVVGILDARYLLVDIRESENKMAVSSSINSGPRNLAGKGTKSSIFILKTFNNFSC